MNNSPIVGTAPAHLPRFVRLPRLYKPDHDTSLLADAVLDEVSRTAPSPSMLELCAGTGYVSVAAARAGARVTALDVSTMAIANTRLNALLNRCDITTIRADLRESPALPRFDLVVANPPYVPALSDDLPTHGMALAYDAGLDGRALIDPVCEQAPRLLLPGGSLLLVQSEVNGVDRTCDLLRRSGLIASVVTRRSIPLGPLMSERAAMLEERGLIERGQRTECISVIRGMLPAGPGPNPDPLGTGAASDDCPADQEPSR